VGYSTTLLCPHGAKRSRISIINIPTYLLQAVATAVVAVVHALMMSAGIQQEKSLM